MGDVREGRGLAGWEVIICTLEFMYTYVLYAYACGEGAEFRYGLRYR